MSFLRKLKVWLGWGSVPDVCEMSRGDKDYHDFHEATGGDGIPTHFHTYTCWNCGKKFTI